MPAKWFFVPSSFSSFILPRDFFSSRKKMKWGRLATCIYQNHLWNLFKKLHSSDPFWDQVGAQSYMFLTGSTKRFIWGYGDRVGHRTSYSAWHKGGWTQLIEKGSAETRINFKLSQNVICPIIIPHYCSCLAKWWSMKKCDLISVWGLCRHAFVNY